MHSEFVCPELKPSVPPLRMTQHAWSGRNNGYGFECSSFFVFLLKCPRYGESVFCNIAFPVPPSIHNISNSDISNTTTLSNTRNINHWSKGILRHPSRNIRTKPTNQRGSECRKQMEQLAEGKTTGDMITRELSGTISSMANKVHTVRPAACTDSPWQTD